jgi:cardiolipin synthase
MVVDDTVAFVKSLNWETKNLTETRDYAIVTDHPREVAEIGRVLRGRLASPSFDARSGCRPGVVSRQRTRAHLRLHRQRASTLFVQNERYQDALVIERLVRAAERGVKVHVMARAPHTLKADKLIEGVGGLRILDDVGVKIHKLKHLKLHGKMFLADGVAGVVGSINLAPGSFDGRRELAIEVRDDAVVERLHDVARADWANSHPLDLSDAGLLADLKDRQDVVEGLLPSS